MNDETIVTTLHDIFADALHAKQVESLSHAVIGVAHAAHAGVASVGRAEAMARAVSPKHAIKQFDRFLSNPRFDLEAAWASIMAFVIGARPKVIVSMDWTDYGEQQRIALSLVTRHGRATPLLGKTIASADLAGNRNVYEDNLLRLFKRLLPPSVQQVIVLADRGFGDAKLYQMLSAELGFDFVIRFRDCILVRSSWGETRCASDWVPSNGRPLLLAQPQVTGRRADVGAVVAVKFSAMKENWLLATSLNLPANEIIRLYQRRFTIEESFRDEKDWRFGLGTRYVRIGRSDRRDRLCFIIAVTTILLTLLGQAGEQLGLARSLRANTSKKRTHSLFRQGREYFRGALGKLPHAATLLLDAFLALLAAQPLVTESEDII